MPKWARALTFAVIASAVLAVASPAADAATAQYPNLKTLPPRDLKLGSADITADGSGVFHNVLMFSNTVWNIGEGKLVMHGTINPTSLDGTAYQRVYNDDGSSVEYPVGRFYYHPQHNHYHYDNWGRYQLFTKSEYDGWVAAGKPKTLPNGVEIGTKTTSCVEDEEFIKDIPGAPYPGIFPGNGCMPDGNQMLLEGISPGWGDTYDYYRFEQWIDLGNQLLPDGDYVLRSVTDDNNQIYESANKADASRESEADNEGITKLRIQGGKLVDQNPPTGTVTINNVDAQTRSTSVTVRALGRDDILAPGDAPNVDQVRLSNNGTTWKTMAYTGDAASGPMTVTWNLADSAYGGNANAGTKTVYAQFHDRAGNWSQTFTDAIEYVAPAPPSSYSQAVSADSPVSYWRLGETSGAQAFDEKAANSGTYNNSPTLGAASLIPNDTTNKAVTFDGTNDYMVAPDTASLDLTNKITLEAWIKPAAIPTAGNFASVMTKPESYSLQFNGPKLEFTVMQNNVRQRLQAAAGAIVAGTTYHVVGTYDGTTQRLYINGVQVATKALTGNATVTDWGNLYFGSWDGTQEYFKGTIDDAAVYNAVLSATRIQAHYTTGTGSGGGGGTPPVTVAAPTGLAATPSTSNDIDVRWTDNATNETSYILERSTSSAFAGVTTITLGANAKSYSDSGLSASTTYYYRVKAVSNSTSSAYSNTATATTPAPPVINSYSQTVLGDGPNAYWRLGETTGTTAGDQKTANPGTYLNAPALGQASLLNSDIQNRAVGLDGTNDNVRVFGSPQLNLTSAITVEAWIKPTSVPTVGFQSVVTKQEAYSIQFNNGRIEFTVVGPNGVRYRDQAPSGAISAGQRYYVVGTFDGQTERLYINGVQVATAAFAGVATISDWSNLYIGSWDGASEFFKGTVDEGAVYARVLTAAQVKNHYDAGLAPPPSGQSSSATSTDTGTTARATQQVVDPPSITAPAPTDAPEGDTIVTPAPLPASEALAQPIVARPATPHAAAVKKPTKAQKSRAAEKKCRAKAKHKHGRAKTKALNACAKKYSRRG